MAVTSTSVPTYLPMKRIGSIFSSAALDTHHKLQPRAGQSWLVPGKHRTYQARSSDSLRFATTILLAFPSFVALRVGRSYRVLNLPHCSAKVCNQWRASLVSEIETVGKRPLVFRVLYLAGGTLYVFIRWNARGKNNRRIPVVLVSFPSKYVPSLLRWRSSLYHDSLSRKTFVQANSHG